MQSDSPEVTVPEIFLAVDSEHSETIDRYLSKPSNINRLSLVEWTRWETRRETSPLHRACALGKWRVVEKFLRIEADANILDSDGWSPLHHASDSGQQQVIELLITAQADINLQDRDGRSPLYIAAAKDYQHVVELLIKAQADVDLQESDGCSPLYIASQDDHQQVVESLIKAQATVDLQRNTGSSPLYVASQYGHQEVVESLIKAKADLNLQRWIGDSPLYIASENGHQQVVESLIKADADVNLQKRGFGFSPLFIASQNGHQQIVESLIRANANVNLQEADDGCSPLYLASHWGQQQIVESLIEGKADVNLQIITGESPLYVASTYGHLQVVESLIKAQADVNRQRSTGESPLYAASEKGHLQIVNLLIKAQADVHLRQNRGGSPLYIAARNGHHQVVQALIKAQAPVNNQEVDGYSPLEIAVEKDHAEVVRLLIEAQAELKIPGKLDYSPQYFLSQDYPQAVESLIKSLFGVNEERHDEEKFLEVFDPLNYCRRADANVNNERHQLADLNDESDSELSQRLHSALTRSGFVDSRAALQSAAADVLQEILRRRMNYDGLFVVGSYSEGWGNSLKTLDGRTDAESDIDMMRLLKGRLYHPEGLCECAGAPTMYEFTNGHLLCPGFTSNPSIESSGSALRPAVDDVTACRLCRYPPIAPLQPDRKSRSNIPNSVLQALEQDLISESTPCHVVHASSPGRGGQELRVSTSFLEKRMLRSLTTLQGQLFVTLKYLVKKVISHKEGFNEQGLKPYHMKTITFRMVEETPVEQWRSENLVSLTRQSLKMLLDCVESSCRPDNPDGRIMEHFFLSDAALYLKGIRHENSEQTLLSIANILRQVLDQLPKLLQKFMDSLKPLSESGTFYFHPFQILPDLSLRPQRESRNLEYHEIYDVVRECLLRLCDDHFSELSQGSIAELTDRLPDCARTARETLRVLASFKFGDTRTADRIVKQCKGHSVSRGIAWPAERLPTEATTEFVWQHLRSQDSAWKFCFEFDQQPELCDRVTESIVPEILYEISNRESYCNFRLLLDFLQKNAMGDSKLKEWTHEIAQREDADEQELFLAATGPADPEFREICLRRLANLIGLSNRKLRQLNDYLRNEYQEADLNPQPLCRIC